MAEHVLGKRREIYVVGKHPHGRDREAELQEPALLANPDVQRKSGLVGRRVFWGE